MSKLINATPEDNLQRAITRLLRAVEQGVRAGAKKPEEWLFEAIMALLNQYPNLGVTSEKTLPDKFSDLMNVLSSATFFTIERYCEGNKSGAYYSAELMAKMIMRKISEEKNEPTS